MSTVLMIRVHEQPGGQLCRFKPKLRGDETEVRKLSVYRELHAWIYAEAEASNVTMEAKGHVRGHLGQFVRGELIDDYYFMKRVEDRRFPMAMFSHGIWAISPRFNPQYRFFGAFATYDWFVALNKQSRDALEQSEARWHAEIDTSTKLWSDLFPGRPVFIGDALGDFVSNAEKLDARW